MTPELKTEVKIQKLRSAAVIKGVPRERVFQCEDCAVVLDQPVEKSGLYVLRDNEPRLICPKCARPDDLYIWGDPELLDHQDWTPAMLKAEQEREQRIIDHATQQKYFDEMQKAELEKARVAAEATQIPLEKEELL